MFKNKKGFTIVELVIVIAVIAILAAVLIPTFSSVIKKANDSSSLQKARTSFEVVSAEVANGSKTIKANEAYIKVKDGDDNTYFVYDGKKVKQTSKTNFETATKADAAKPLTKLGSTHLSTEALDDIGTDVEVYLEASLATKLADELK